MARAERDSRHDLRVNHARNLHAGGGDEYAGCIVLACGGHIVSLWAERNGTNGSLVIQSRDLRPVCCLDDPRGAIRARDRQLATVGIERQPVHLLEIICAPHLIPGLYIE